MFSLLVGLGALLLAVFVSAMLDPRPSRSAAAAERARADDGCDPSMARCSRESRSAPPFAGLPAQSADWRTIALTTAG
jgi:hypothetical protein